MQQSMQQVLVSLSSYGASEVRRHGQEVFARIALDAGADGVEVRGELLRDSLTDAHAELRRIRELARDARLVYSSPDGLWGAGGFDDAAVARAIEAARLLGAPRVKMAIGAFDARDAASLPSLRRFADAGLELVIENDQTDSAGTLDALLAFYSAADRDGFAPGLTFDMGNWHWTGECPQAAAAKLGTRVAYVHCKGVQRLPAKWVAVPIAESAAPWRTVLRAMPADKPWAIEYPLMGDDLVEVTRREIALLRAASARLASSRLEPSR